MEAFDIFSDKIWFFGHFFTIGITVFWRIFCSIFLFHIFWCFLKKTLILTWFSASQRAFKFKLVKVKGKCWSRFPETSSTCSSLQVPISDGTDRSWFSRSEKTPILTRFPICGGRYSNRFLSTLKFVNIVKSPILAGNSLI